MVCVDQRPPAPQLSPARRIAALYVRLSSMPAHGTLSGEFWLRLATGHWLNRQIDGRGIRPYSGEDACPERVGLHRFDPLFNAGQVDFYIPPDFEGRFATNQ